MTELSMVLARQSKVELKININFLDTESSEAAACCPTQPYLPWSRHSAAVARLSQNITLFYHITIIIHVNIISQFILFVFLNIFLKYHTCKTFIALHKFVLSMINKPVLTGSDNDDDKIQSVHWHCHCTFVVLYNTEHIVHTARVVANVTNLSFAVDLFLRLLHL